MRGNSMPSSGWQVSLSAHLQHYAHVITGWAKTVPGWITGLAVVAALLGLGWRALAHVAGVRERRGAPPASRRVTSIPSQEDTS